MWGPDPNQLTARVFF